MAQTGRSGPVGRAVKLEEFTVAWMAAEAGLAIGAGMAARRVLPTAFGADSVIELLSGATLLWRLRVEHRGDDVVRVEGVERRAVRISALLLVLLCAYVAVTSAAGVAIHLEAERFWLGVAVAVAAVVVIPWLAYRKRAANGTIQSPALRADIAESIMCAYMAGVTLVGVGVNLVTGWWWVEYLAAIALLRWLIPEASEAWGAAREGSERYGQD